MSKITGTIPLVLAFSVAALAVSGAAYGAKPKPGPDINAAVCTGISGVWTPHTCTIYEGSNGVASSNFKLTKPNTLDVKGSLTINAGVTISNDGTILVENVAGATPPDYFDSGLLAGILILGTLDNSGAITIQNALVDTVGIAVSVSASASDPSDPNTWRFVPGILDNSGRITIQNAGLTQGINNFGALNNAAAGTITVANSLPGSVGIRNGREGIHGTVINDGHITVANSGDVGDTKGRGISNAGAFTNSATGVFTLNPSAVAGDTSWGLRNNGTFTNFGTFINNRGTLNESDYINSTWGSYNLSPGVMMNYGKTYVGTATDRSGTFYSEFMMLNFGEISSYGVLYGGGYINYATFYNYGLIDGGLNAGICIDEPGGSGC